MIYDWIHFNQIIFDAKDTLYVTKSLKLCICHSKKKFIKIGLKVIILSLYGYYWNSDCVTRNAVLFI